MLVGNLATCPDRERYVCILMDEMHIKENLVYDKHTGKYHKLEKWFPLQGERGHSSYFRCLKTK